LRVLFDRASADPLVLLERAPRSAKCILQGDIGVLVRGIVSVRVTDHDLLARHGDRQPDLEECTLLMMLVMRGFDHDLTT
jgi:hypothetical protein